MDRKREDGGRRSALGRLKQKLGRLFGPRKTVAPGQEDEVERQLRETYDKPTEEIRTRSAFRQ